MNESDYRSIIELYKSFEEKGFYDKDETFLEVVNWYIKNGFLKKDEYIIIGQIYSTISDYVKSTYDR